MTVPEMKLNEIKKTVDKKREFRASDFLTDEELDELRTKNIKGTKRKKYSEVDAYIAEIISRFGYDTYVAWKFGEISSENMAKYVQAERARDAMWKLSIENVIVAAMAGANNPTKTGHAPRSLKAAIKMLKNEEKLAKGGF